MLFFPFSAGCVFMNYALSDISGDEPFPTEVINRSIVSGVRPDFDTVPWHYKLFFCFFSSLKFYRLRHQV